MHSKRTWWPVLSGIALSAVALCAIFLGIVSAQNLPPPGAYQPIPNFTGVGAGLQFREAINERMSGAQPILPLVVGPNFANLPAEQDGLLLYCKDCKRATPCVGGGSGAWARGNRGAWSCAIDALETSLNANGNKITALANGTTAGDAISFGQPSGGDLSGAIPNPTVASVLGGQVPVTKSTAMTGGDLSGTLPAPTVQSVLGGKAPIYAGQTGAQINTLSGSKGDGSDAITSFNVNGVLNAKAHGAKGDGSTDDTAAIQATRNAGCATGSPIMLPPATGYKITSPLWENCNNGSLIGSGGLGPIEPAYDFGFTIALVGSTYPGIPLTTSLVTGAGNAFDFRTDQTHNWVNLREWDGVNGPLGAPSGLNMNGLGTFSVEAFVNDVTAGDGDVVSSDSVPSSAGETDSWLLRINAGRWDFTMTTTAGNCDASGSGSAVTLGTNQYVAGTYDGSTCRLYVCAPGSTNCAVTESGSQTGSLVQDPTEDVTIGPSMGQGWPNGGAYRGAIKGIIDSVRISKIARYTGTIATVPNAKFSVDSNTLILTNGETAPNGAPFIKAYDGGGFSGAWGYGWLYEYNGNNSALTNQSYNNIQNLLIEPQGKDVSGVILSNTHEATLNNVTCGVFGGNGCEIGFELWDLAYNNLGLSNLYYNGTPGRYGIAASNANDNFFYNTQVTGAWVCEAINGNATLTNPLCTQSSITVPRFGLAISSGIGGTVTEIGAQDDAEGSGAFTHLFMTGAENYTGISGALAAAAGGAGAWLDNGATATFIGPKFYNANGSPTQIIEATGTASKVVLTNPTFSGFGSAVLSSNPGVATVSPCKGSVTLAAGAGTFSNVCVTTTSLCSARDTTTPANAVTLGVPANGSVTVSGTATDSIVLSCV